MSTVDTGAVLTMLQEVAAQVVTPRFRALVEGEVMEKSPGDLVTVADHEAEVVITDWLRVACPDALVLGEEASAADPALLEGLAQVPHWFTVDPVDGTRNFVHGSPDHALMIGEVVGGQPVRAWIWQPEHRRAYVAEKGAGAFCDGERLVAVERPESPRGVTSRRGLVGRVLGEGLEPLALSWVCCGVDYPSIAAGLADYVVYGRTMPWDHVPGSLLLTETGGRVCRLDGSGYDPSSTEGGLLAASDETVAAGVLPLLAGLGRGD